MIRLFAGLCKSLLKKISEEAVFQKATDEYSHHGKKCPSCGAAGQLAAHGQYSRDLTSFSEGTITDSRASPKRVRCESCKATHAILPDIIIPYCRYSLVFILAVLIAYYERGDTVVKICERYLISVSTLYEWKKRMLSHKELMLGVLISQKTPALAFISGLLGSRCLSDPLLHFFRKHGFSFLQRQSAPAPRSRPP